MEKFKKVQIVLLPTQNKTNALWSYKERRLYSNEDSNLNDEDYTTCYHLYFLSDDDIKEGDWCYNPQNANKIFRVTDLEWINKINIKYSNVVKKIITTTNTLLTNETFQYYGMSCFKGVSSLPQPSQDFIDEYVKAYNDGMITTGVLVEYEQIRDQFATLDNSQLTYFNRLKINSDNTINIKSAKESWNRQELIKAMIWAERNGKDYVGTDKEGQLKQFNEYIDKL